MALEGPKSTRAKSFASQIMSELNNHDDDAEDDQMRKAVKKE
jgi:hypothetical protein